MYPYDHGTPHSRPPHHSRNVWLLSRRCAFERMDVSETGRITLDDLTTVLGAHYDHAELKELLDSADANHDGTLDYAEFEVLMRSTVGKTR